MLQSVSIGNLETRSLHFRKVESGDQTEILQAGYWPSYNVPFYEDIFRVSGYAEMVEKHGMDFSHQLCARAKIFRRDQGNVSIEHASSRRGCIETQIGFFFKFSGTWSGIYGIYHAL